MNYYMSYIMNPFIEACKVGNLPLVTKYIKDGIDPSMDNNQAIIEASSMDHNEVVKMLLQDPRVDPSIDSIILLNICQNGHIDTIRILLQDTRIDIHQYRNVFEDIISSGHLVIIELFLHNLKLESEDYNKIFMLLCAYNFDGLVKLLLRDPRVDPSANNNAAIKYASNNGNYHIVRTLIQDPRVDPSDNNNAAIIEASLYGRLRVVKLLLKDPRVDPSVDNYYCIRVAEMHNHRKVLYQLLIHSRTTVPYNMWDGIIKWACKNAYYNIVKLYTYLYPIDSMPDINHIIYNRIKQKRLKIGTACVKYIPLYKDLREEVLKYI